MSAEKLVLERQMRFALYRCFFRALTTDGAWLCTKLAGHEGTHVALAPSAHDPDYAVCFGERVFPR